MEFPRDHVGTGRKKTMTDKKPCRAVWQPDEPHYTRGYAKLYIDTVLQADKGADLDFLVSKDTRLVTRESH